MDKASWALLLSAISIIWTIVWSLFTRPKPKLIFHVEDRGYVEVISDTPLKGGDARSFRVDIFNSGTGKEQLVGYRIKQKGVWGSFDRRFNVVVEAGGNDRVEMVVLYKDHDLIEGICFETPTGKKWKLPKELLVFIKNNIDPRGEK